MKHNVIDWFIMPAPACKPRTEGVTASALCTHRTLTFKTAFGALRPLGTLRWTILNTFCNAGIKFIKASQKQKVKP